MGCFFHRSSEIVVGEYTAGNWSIPITSLASAVNYSYHNNIPLYEGTQPVNYYYYPCLNVNFNALHYQAIKNTSLQNCGTNTIKTIHNEKKLSCYPNPVGNLLTVGFPDEEIKEIRLTDVLGKEVLRTKEKEIDVSSLESGVYFIEAGTASGRFTQKVIVQH